MRWSARKQQQINVVVLIIRKQEVELTEASVNGELDLIFDPDLVIEVINLLYF